MHMKTGTDKLRADFLNNNWNNSRANAIQKLWQKNIKSNSDYTGIK